MKIQKILYIVGAIIAVIGLLAFIFGAGFLGLLMLLGGVGFIFIVFVSSKLINASKSATDGSEGEDLSLEMKINNALTKARQDKFKAESDMRRLKNMAQDSIAATYGDFLGGQLALEKEKLLLRYEDIKGQYSSKVSFEMADRCENLVKGCQQQIALQESKVVLFEKLFTEYTGLKEKIRIAKQQDKKVQKLTQYENKLQEMSDDVSGIAAGINHQYTLDDLQKEVALKEEYFSQLEKLQYQYGDQPNANGAIAYKSKVDEMINGLKQ